MLVTPLTILRDPQAPAVALLSIAVGKYGLECFDWDPALLRKEIQEDFEVDLTDAQAEKIQAAILIITTDFFESNWEVFNVCVRVLNGEYGEFETFEPLEAEHIAGAMPEIEYLRNEDEDGMKFSPEVNTYAGLVFLEYGCSQAPDVFPTALMPKAVVDSEMTEKNAALRELYQAKKDFLEKYIQRVSSIYD